MRGFLFGGGGCRFLKQKLMTHHECKKKKEREIPAGDSSVSHSYIAQTRQRKARYDHMTDTKNRLYETKSRLHKIKTVRSMNMRSDTSLKTA